jgi:hypothetical protein
MRPRPLSLPLPAPALALVAAALLLLLALPGPASAGLDGRWLFSYRTPDGVAVAVPITIEDHGGTFTAEAAYHVNGKPVRDEISGKVDPTGQVSFTVRRGGLELPHKGELAKNGRSISGWYTEPAGPGTFTLDRGPIGAAYPSLTGDWAYEFREAGTDPHAGTCTLASRAGGSFTGTLRYAGSGVEAQISGSTDLDGNLHFTVREAGRDVRHTGTLARDGRSASGHWQADWSSGSFTLTRNP